MSRPLLSIAIPTYNRASLLDLCLTRVIEQLPATGEVEVLVSNNASTDDTRAVVARHQAAYPALRYSENEQNGGPDFNIAKAFELATGKYAWVFSDDDLLLPGALAYVLPLLRQPAEWGIVFVTSHFYRHSIEEYVAPQGPPTHTVFNDPHQLADETHFWLTYISGIITNKELVSGAKTLYQYQNSNMIQLGWVMPALFSGRPSLRIETPFVLGRGLETLDFKLFQVFGASYPRVLEGLAQQGVLPVKTKEMLIEAIIRRYFIAYIQPQYRYTHGENPLLILGRSFWKRPSFWTVLVPRLVRRTLVRGAARVLPARSQTA
jgi:glycosyltransferase involved in cell wall biosynthesis